MTTPAWTAFLDEERPRIEAALDRALSVPPECPSIVLEAMRYSLLGGGKRMRPLLVLASAGAVARRAGGSLDDARRLAMPAACAIEMIHTYSLIHDDLPAMDDDALRRGRPTLHVLHGEGLAVLAGDGLHAEAFVVLARDPESDDPVITARKLAVIRLVGEAAGPAGMVGGQALDLAAVEAPTGRPMTPEALEDMHARKTGALIRASALAGAMMAGADPATAAAVGRYGTAIGLAFQIVDDILDIEGNAAGLGKTAGKDAAAGKPTYPAIHGIDRSRALAADCLARADAALADAGLADSLLRDIGRWIVARTS
ncbi:MAG: polyprenyl synthetase family protein [Vicinamibacterales bacterium]|nr:polyprenyl synthetase family protein [Vicinamibacterales bacterium]